jgi:hypothetical protein
MTDQRGRVDDLDSDLRPYVTSPRKERSRHEGAEEEHEKP